MHGAKLGGIPGAGDVRSRRGFEGVREYRGTFVSRRENDEALRRLMETRERVEFEGLVDGERKTLRVIVTDVSPETAMVFFQAVRE